MLMRSFFVALIKLCFRSQHEFISLLAFSREVKTILENEMNPFC
jgi:hypothetical protein